MKKTITLLISVVTLCLFFTACKCEHQYEEQITTEASCDAVGVKTFTCTQCGDSYTEEIPMVEHSYTSKVTKSSSCTQNGEKTFTCSGCGDSYTEEIALVQHVFINEVVTKQPTCVETGIKQLECMLCGALGDEQDIPVGDHVYEKSEEKQSTCTKNGFVKHTCTICGDEQEEIIEATGHNWKAATCEKAKKCTICGNTEGSKLGHNYVNGTCKRCGDQAISVTVEDLPVVRSMIVSSTGTTAEQVRISKCNVTVGDGQVTATVTFTKTYSYYDDKLYPAVGFYVALTDMDRNIIKVVEVYVRNVYVGQTKTITAQFSNVESGEYMICFANLSI